MTIEEMKQRKIELGLTNEMIAELADLPKSTVQKIFAGVTKAPRKTTLDALSAVLSKTGRPFPNKQGSPESLSAYAKEMYGSYNALPEKDLYTICDYDKLPEDRRAELIDGQFYDLGSPAAIHQLILSHLHMLFMECADQHGLLCEILEAPFDVRLDRDNYTVVQPDLMVICHDFDIHALRFEGAPDLIVEILSPSSRMKDMLLKLNKYHHAGVREYWIADPGKQTVIAHRFTDPEYEPEKYSFEDTIPVGISEGRCSIDFSRIRKRISRYEVQKQ